MRPRPQGRGFLYMLPKSERLTKFDFNEVFSKGKIYSSPTLLSKVLNTKREKSRFGVSVSKKISPSAVVRNKIRRMVYRSIGKIKSVIKNIDCVIIVKKDISDLSTQEIDKSVEGLLSDRINTL